MFHHKNNGTCSTAVHFDIIDGKVCNVSFDRGCRGNLQGVSALVEGMDAREAIRRMEGIQCRGNTSCPDQLAQAIKEALAEIEAAQ